MISDQMHENSIQVFLSRCSVVSEAQAQSYRSLLSEDELARNERYRFKRDRHRDLIARALVRTSLSDQLNCRPEELVFVPDDHGKPQLIEPRTDVSLFFNLSHSGDQIVLAIANATVGIDVEYIDRKNDVLEIADRYFFGAEYDELMSFPLSDRRDRFFDYWTLKEAYMKARGEGLSLGLSNFGFQITNGIRLELDSAIQDDPDEWQFFCLSPNDGYRLSLAVKSRSELCFITREVIPLAGDRQLNWTIN